ncbi:hypothetical protein RIF29_42516 [Crotalaria pallida]|uniref:RNA methyltransferase n=1 Tax=Crotalaria pallida TaxID=3830 RepID=A0AAN9E7G0_CROPI
MEYDYDAEGEEDETHMEEQEVKKQKKKTKKRSKNYYGNAKNYYTQRNGGESGEDPRLNVFKKEWFEGKHCLDIGCNSGILTIQIDSVVLISECYSFSRTTALKFCCRSILGIDIDSARVKEANLNLSKTVESISAEKKRNLNLEASKLKRLNQEHVLGSDVHSDRVEDTNSILSKTDESESAEKKGIRVWADKLGQDVCASSDDEEELRDFLFDVLSFKPEIFEPIPQEFLTLKERKLSDIVSFKQENFLESGYDPLGQHYDTILCLSVTQWIHLNWGDEGLKTLFHKILSILRPGGLFVFEPHKWETYKEKQSDSQFECDTMDNLNWGDEGIKASFHKIRNMLRPIMKTHVAGYTVSDEQSLDELLLNGKAKKKIELLAAMVGVDTTDPAIVLTQVVRILKVLEKMN